MVNVNKVNVQVNVNKVNVKVNVNKVNEKVNHICSIHSLYKGKHRRGAAAGGRGTSSVVAMNRVDVVDLVVDLVDVDLDIDLVDVDLDVDLVDVGLVDVVLAAFSVFGL